MDTLREQLAAYAHDDAWAHWMRYMLGKLPLADDGSMTIPPDLVARWMRQATTAYADLPESERDSDRRQADRILAIVDRQLAAAREWQPVEDGFVHRCRCADCREPNAWQWEIYVNGASIGIQDPKNDADDRFVELPIDYALCRRTPAQAAQP